MSLSVKVQPIDKDLAVLFPDVFSPAARSAMLAQVARTALADAEAQDEAVLGVVPTHVTYVDGSAGASEDGVRPDGVIVYEFSLVSDVFLWIDEQLQIHSPSRSGRFSRSLKLYADGVEVDPSGPIPDAVEYVYLNTQPYSRKIERGFSPQAPNGVFEAVAALARARFGKLAKISFTYRAVVGGEIGQWAASASAKRLAARKRRSKSMEWLTQSPAIVITVK